MKFQVSPPFRFGARRSGLNKEHGYLLAQSLFQTELPGEDMVRHANRFLEKTWQKSLRKRFGQSLSTRRTIASTTNFIRCYVSPPTSSNKKHEKADLLTCKKLRVSYNLGIWVDIEFKVKTFAVVPPLRNFRRRASSKCFFAPCMFLEATSSDPTTSKRGFVCRRTVKEGYQSVYDQRLDVEFAPNVLRDFHEDGQRRQNNNSANLVDCPTYIKQLWSNTAPQAFDRKVWACRPGNHDFHLLVKNIVMIGEFDESRDIFLVKHMGKK